MPTTTPPLAERLVRSGIGLQSVPSGIAVEPPATAAAAEILEAVCEAAGAVRSEDGWLLTISQTDRNGVLVDMADRVQLAAAFLAQAHCRRALSSPPTSNPRSKAASGHRDTDRMGTLSAADPKPVQRWSLW